MTPAQTQQNLNAALTQLSQRFDLLNRRLTALETTIATVVPGRDANATDLAPQPIPDAERPSQAILALFPGLTHIPQAAENRNVRPGAPMSDPRDLDDSVEWNDRDPHSGQGTRSAARSGFGITVSVRHDIWPELEALCRKTFPTLRGLDLRPETELRKVIGRGDLATVLREMIAHSGRFATDGAVPHVADLERSRSFLDVCHSLGRVYGMLGHSLRE